MYYSRVFFYAIYLTHPESNSVILRATYLPPIDIVYLLAIDHRIYDLYDL